VVSWTTAETEFTRLRVACLPRPRRVRTTVAWKCCQEAHAKLQYRSAERSTSWLEHRLSPGARVAGARNPCSGAHAYCLKVRAREGGRPFAISVAMTHRTPVSLFAGAVMCVSMTLASCGNPNLHVARSPTAPFATFHTFSLGPAEITPGRYRTSPQSAEVRRRIAPVIVEELQKKGYRLSAEGKPDFVVMFGTGRRDRTTTHEGWAHNDWIVEDEEEDFVEGAIVIDAYQGEGDAQIWHGALRVRIEGTRVDEDRLRRSVHDILASFPTAAP
jgi:Domain of unknown function (DUF4136)